jgi:hypothetical protein
MAADGHVVDYFYGCGAHSDTPAPAGAGSPVYEPFDDGVIEVVTVGPAVEPAGQDAEESAPDAEIVMEPDAHIEPEPAEPETTAEITDLVGGQDDSPTGPDEPAGLL